MIKVGKQILSLDDISRFLGGAKVSLDADALEKTNKSFEFLSAFSKNKIIYGINTGFGPMAQTRIGETDQKALQYNLIRSHASGFGKPLEQDDVRVLMLVRLNALMQGSSGIHNNVPERIVDWLNAGIYPLVFDHGGVGASGDLVQLAHFALGLIGEGECFYQGKRRPTSEVLKETGILPIEIHLREGLALLNGTSCMTGIGLNNLLSAQKLFHWTLAASILINEVVESFDDHYSEGLNRVKQHKGQNQVARWMSTFLKDSQLTRKREKELYDGKLNGHSIERKVQEYYSLRCIPQILGPVWDTLENTGKVLIDETNSAGDNPIIDHEEQNVFHGGNFHGDYVSLEMDKLKTVVTKMSMLSERQLNFLCNDKLNDKIPPFANLGILGLNYGVQGMQFSATSTVAENQALCSPVYVHSIPSNNDNQDIVSMGSNAALMAKKVIDNSYGVLAIEFFALIQAVEYLKIESKLSTFSQKVYKEISAIAPPFTEDEPKYPQIEKLREFLANHIPAMMKTADVSPKEKRVQ